MFIHCLQSRWCTEPQGTLVFHFDLQIDYANLWSYIVVCAWYCGQLECDLWPTLLDLSPSLVSLTEVGALEGRAPYHIKEWTVMLFYIYFRYTYSAHCPWQLCLGQWVSSLLVIGRGFSDVIHTHWAFKYSLEGFIWCQDVNIIPTSPLVNDLATAPQRPVDCWSPPSHPAFDASGVFFNNMIAMDGQK